MSVAKAIVAESPADPTWIVIEDNQGKRYRYERTGEVTSFGTVHLHRTFGRFDLVHTADGVAPVLRQDRPGLPTTIIVREQQSGGVSGDPIGGAWAGGAPAYEYRQVQCRVDLLRGSPPMRQEAGYASFFSLPVQTTDDFKCSPRDVITLDQAQRIGDSLDIGNAIGRVDDAGEVEWRKTD
jgi:hypothetical protein